MSQATCLREEKTMKSYKAARWLITLFCFQAKCEEDMDLFKEVIYTLLGLIMNLCLEGPFISEVQCSHHPPWSPGTDTWRWLVHVFTK